MDMTFETWLKYFLMFSRGTLTFIETPLGRYWKIRYWGRLWITDSDYPIVCLAVRYGITVADRPYINSLLTTVRAKILDGLDKSDSDKILGYLITRQYIKAAELLIRLDRLLPPCCKKLYNPDCRLSWGYREVFKKQSYTQAFVVPVIAELNHTN